MSDVNQATPPPFGYGRFTRSFKRDGRMGVGYAVVRRNEDGRCVSVAKVDIESEAAFLTEELSTGRIDYRDQDGMRAALRRFRSEVSDV